MALRDDFPLSDAAAPGATSDGWIYVTRFAGSTLKNSYDMLRAFLVEEGYGQVPIPNNVEELLLFRAPKRERQYRLFEDNGYVHNPIKILFSSHHPNPRTLELRLFNEKMPQHLLRFYGVLPIEQVKSVNEVIPPVDK